MLNTAPTRGFWIGMSNRRSSRRYTWSDNSGVTYTWWDTAEPNLYGNKGASCVALFLQTGRWNDGPCEDLLPGFVCEQPKLLLPTTTQSPFEVGCTMVCFYPFQHRGQSYTTFLLFNLRLKHVDWLILSCLLRV